MENKFRIYKKPNKTYTRQWAQGEVGPLPDKSGPRTEKIKPKPTQKHLNSMSAPLG
jgi:hypothetical protein